MISDFWSFIWVMLRFGRELIEQEYYIRRYLLPRLKAAKHHTDGSFTDKHIKRMGYYARFVPAVSGANYALLANRRMSHKERMQMLKLGAAAALFDDYFDDPTLSHLDLKCIMDTLADYVPRNARERIFVELLREVKSGVVFVDACMDIGYKVYAAQVEAEKQSEGGLSQAEIYRITFDKGGYSTVMFTYLMDKPEDEKAAAAVYHFGGMIQWVDDIFDLYEDQQDKLETLVTTATDMHQLREAYERDLYKLKDLFAALDYLPRRNILKFMDLQLFFFSRALVCLQQFQDLQNQHAIPFDAGSFTRKQLICDMEKWANIKLWFHYFRLWKKRLAD